MIIFEWTSLHHIYLFIHGKVYQCVYSLSLFSFFLCGPFATQHIHFSIINSPDFLVNHICVWGEVRCVLTIHWVCCRYGFRLSLIWVFFSTQSISLYSLFHRYTHNVSVHTHTFHFTLCFMHITKMWHRNVYVCMCMVCSSFCNSRRVYVPLDDGTL